MEKKVYVKTYGCQMNIYDTTRMLDVLYPFGFIASDREEDADIVILTTCCIREKALEKMFSDLGRLRSLKSARSSLGKRTLLVVAGCAAQSSGTEILERAPYVDIVLGTQVYHRLPEIVARAHNGHLLEVQFPPEHKFDHLPSPTAHGVAVYLPVQEGCNRFCTFCVVPYTRGTEYSRPATAVLAEARHLVATGAKEITLLGQNVNTYRGMSPEGDGYWGLGRLLESLAQIDHLYRLRFLTSHPCGIDEELIQAFRDLPRLMPYLHLPVQSGSDRILAAMNRGHTVSDYRLLVERLRKACPALALSSDFIVGFPGETEEDFTDTLNLVHSMGYAQAYSFKFSPRPGTPAARAADQIPEPVKSERLKRLQKVLSEQQKSFNSLFLGCSVPVLIEHRGPRTHQMIGRSPYMQVVTVTAQENILGQIVDLRIERIRSNSLDGTLVTSAHSTACVAQDGQCGERKLQV